MDWVFTVGMSTLSCILRNQDILESVIKSLSAGYVRLSYAFLSLHPALLFITRLSDMLPYL
jgi:hypothetical protein